MKIRTRLLGVSAAMAVACTGLAPLPASAEAENYDLFVNGSQFTSENLTIACGEGTAVFDGKDTLTLNNATLTKPSASPEGSWLYGIINSGIKDLKIVLEGENVIDVTGNEFDGIDSAGGCSVTITGSGSLEMKEPYYGTYIGYWEVPGADLTVTGGAKLTVTDPTCAGIWVNHDITFEGCTAEVTKSGESFYNGIVSNVGGTVTFTDSDVSVSSWCEALAFGNGDDTEHAMVVNSGTVKLESRSEPEANNRYKGVAISCEPDGTSQEVKITLTVNGGTLDVTAKGRCVDFTEDKITLGEGVSYTKGTSLTEGGNVVIAAGPAFIPGDIDGSGSLTMKDLTTLQRYINGWNVTVVDAALDVNGDGDVNMRDLTTLQKLINAM